MLTKSKPSFARRLAGAALIATLGAAGGYAAWAANPAETIAENHALPVAAEQPPAAPPAALPAPRAAEDKASDPAAPSEVCLTNACSEAAKLPEAPPGRVSYVGAAQIPAGPAFVRYFDADSPVEVNGRVSNVRMTDGMAADLYVQGEDGKLYRVIGSDPARLPPDMRAAFQDMVGREVKVRGYLAHDRTCEGGCIVNGRDVSFPDGAPALQGRPSAAWRGSERFLSDYRSGQLPEQR